MMKWSMWATCFFLTLTLLSLFWEIVCIGPTCSVQIIVQWILVKWRTDRLQTEYDAYEPTVQVAQVGSKMCKLIWACPLMTVCATKSQQNMPMLEKMVESVSNTRDSFK